MILKRTLQTGDIVKLNSFFALGSYLLGLVTKDMENSNSPVELTLFDAQGKLLLNSNPQLFSFSKNGNRFVRGISKKFPVAETYEVSELDLEYLALEIIRTGYLQKKFSKQRMREHNKNQRLGLA